MNELDRVLQESGIIAIVRGNYPTERLRTIGEALARGGVQALEVTLNSRGALEGIAALRETLPPDVLVGAGTVRTAADVDRALAAGAQFLISPNFDRDSVARSAAAGVPHLPGVFTATEVQIAFASGCRTVKLFPADALGPPYLKALRAPLDDVGFVPTGGIHAGNVADYVRAGAAGLGVGSALVSGPDQDPEEIRQRAALLVSAYRGCRS